MAHVDKTIKKAFLAQVAGGALIGMSASGTIPMNQTVRIGVFGAGVGLTTGGTVAGYMRLGQLAKERAEKKRKEETQIKPSK